MARTPRRGAQPGLQVLQAGATIPSDGPLTRVFISTDLNCAVNHCDDVDPEFFGDTACGTLLVAGDYRRRRGRVGKLAGRS